MIQPPEPSSDSLLYAAILGIGGFLSHVTYKVLTPLYVKRVEEAASKIHKAEADQEERLERAEAVMAEQAEQLLDLSVKFATAETELSLMRKRLEGVEQSKKELRAQVVGLSSRFEDCEKERAELRVEIALAGRPSEGKDGEAGK